MGEAQGRLGEFVVVTNAGPQTSNVDDRRAGNTARIIAWALIARDEVYRVPPALA